MRKEIWLRAFLSVVSAFLVPRLVRAHLEPVREAEPNDTPTTATPLTTMTTCFGAVGAISPAGDVDYFSFAAPPGSRAWVLVATGASTGSSLSILTLFSPVGTTWMERNQQ